MTTVSDPLKDTWGAVVSEAPQGEGYYHRRIPLSGAWPVHAGIHRPRGTRFLILETELNSVRTVSLKDETKGYSIYVSPDEAGRVDRANIWIQETNAAYGEIFTVFCADVLEHWVPHASAYDSLNSLSRRLARWKKFFQRGTQSLSREDYIGLYGELTFVEQGINSGVSILSILYAWQAPLNTNQDFLFGPLAVEIKTTTSNEVDKIRITNARQLDPTGLNDLFLIRYAFDFRVGTGRTLPQLILALKASLGSVSPESLSIFNDRLLETGFVEGTPNDFDDWGFTPRRSDVFTVIDGFPCLLESNLPPGVSEISYTLNLSAAQQFHIPETTFWEGLISSYG